MNTLIVKLPPGLAHRLEIAAGHINLTREEAAIEALRLFTRSIAAELRPRFTSEEKTRKRRSRGR